jgi:dTMP kinase
MENRDNAIHKDIGTLIACEGISACGKSESIRELSEYLNSLGYHVHIAEWNSNEKIRYLVKYLHSKRLLNAFSYCILQWISFLKDYYTSILPLLKKNYIVIADRYIYTGINRDKVNGTTCKIGHIILKLVRTPDILFFFDTNPEICAKRIKMRDKELFHTNKNIHNNSFLVDKDLYYLKQMKTEYMKYFGNPENTENTNVIHIINNHCHMNEHVKDYIDKKQFGIHESHVFNGTHGM